MRLFSKSTPELTDDRLERQHLLSAQSDFFLQEAFKTLRTNVMFSLTEESKCKVITVTSSMVGEGKSYTAANLALSFKQMDKRVLLIDCDLRRPKLSRLLQLSSSVGLTNVLMEPTHMKEALLLYGDIGLEVILSGSIPPNPSELLGSKRMETLLGALKGSYEYIILDAPPINMVTDAAILSNLSSGVLFVVRAGSADQRGVQHAITQLEYANAKILGFVLNGVNAESGGYGYKRYGYRRYGYGYKRYGYRQYGYGYQAGQNPSASPAAQGIQPKK
jgi:capsular exopolysaccharide synthesis family protein